jgi:uroporphyrinogen III methyltransferase/synthase
MGFARLGAVAAELVRHGKPADTPAAAVAHASTGAQRTVTSTLTGLDAAVRVAGLTTPALVLIGPAVGLKPEQSWFEARPLLGRCVLVTRPRHQAAGMMRRLELLGATPYLLPALEIRLPSDWRLVDAAQERLRAGEFDWLVFTSANGVDMFLRRLRERGRDLRALGGVQIAVVGSSTADALRGFHLEPDVAPEGELNSEQLVNELMERAAGGRVLVAQADRARDLVRERLGQVAQVEAVTVYETVDAVDMNSEAFGRLRRGEIDNVTLTSPNVARAILAACDEETAGHIRRGRTRLITNSPRATATVEGLGFPVAAESKGPTADDLIEALLNLSKG